MYQKMRNFRRCGRRCAASQPVPRRVPVPSRNGWALIAPGGFHACAIRAGHALWCWGYNATGELGLDSTAEQHRAQQVTR
jgi:alpha-tubulin suppressor-like RCC1 family protein